MSVEPLLLKLLRYSWLTRRTRIGSLMAEGQRIHDDFALVMAGLRRHWPGKHPKIAERSTLTVTLLYTIVLSEIELLSSG